MIKLTEILSKPIISINECKNEGTVLGAVFDKNFKRLKYLVLFNDINNDIKTLSINSIFSYGENAIIIKEDKDLSILASSNEIDEKKSVINCDCYTYLGKFLGKISDIVMDDKYYIQNIVVKDKEIKVADIIKTGDDTVIVQDSENKVSVAKLKSKKKRVVKIEEIKLTSEQKVYILNPENSIEENVNEKNLTEKQDGEEVKDKTKYIITDTPSKPQLLTTNFDMLIGRKLSQNIYSSSFELIARKNTKITKEILEKARLLNKTRELVKYSH